MKKNHSYKSTLLSFAFQACLGLLLTLATANALKAQCLFLDPTVEHTACNNVNEFNVIIDFEWGGGTDSCTITGNGNNYGTFAKADAPITLVSPFFIGDGMTVYEFTISDAEFTASCDAELLLGTVTCGSMPLCEINNLLVEAGNCNPNGVFNITVNFEAQNPGNDFFDLFINQDFIGFYPLSSLPLTVPFGPSSGNGLVQVCINDNPDCCATIEYNNPCNNNCEIWDVTATPSDCNADGLFDVAIDFNYANTSGSFTINGNGNSYGTFSYADLPITLENLEGNGMTYEFVIHDADHPACSDFAILESENCLGGGDCEIVDFNVEAFDCNPNGTYNITVNFEVNNPTHDHFDLFVNGSMFGYYALADLPLTISYNGGAGNGLVQVCINDNPDCCATIEYNNPCNNNCEIWDVTATPSDCNADGLFDVAIDFNYANTSGSFTINGNGNSYGTFSYADLPITLENLEGNGITYEFVIHDADHPACSDFAILESENCLGGGDCEIVDFNVEAFDCNPNGTYNITVNFEVNNPTHDHFDLFVNGSMFGYYALADLPLTISYNGGAGNGLVQACINDNPDCCATIEYNNPCNNNCEIWDVTATPSDCNADGLFDAVIDFNYANTSGSFTINGNGNSYGTFSYADLPITLENLEGNGITYEFVIHDADHPACSDFAILESENCLGGGDCEIVDFNVEAFDCNPNGTYNITVNFEVNNPTHDHFDLFVNGSMFGYYALADLPLTISYNGGAGNGLVQVCINDNPDCCATIEYNNPCNNDCEIWDVTATPSDCNADGLFDVAIDFNYANTSGSFTINGNGNSYGTFSYADLPITLENLEGNGMTYEFVIHDADHPACSDFAILESENCLGGGDCTISDLDVYPLTCNPDGTYSVLVIFDYENVTSDFFDVYASNNNFIGTYSYADLPLTIGSYPASGNANDVLKVCDHDSELCCITTEFEALDCESCEIVAVLLEDQPCNTDDQFMVTLDVEIQGSGSLGFLVLGNGTNYGIFDYNDLPIELGPFTGDGLTEYEFIVVDLANTNCVGSASIGPIDCQTPQPVWPGDANQDFISNHFDLLNIGIAYGETGAARSQTDIDWMSFDGANWSGAFANGVNWKHADCNGDGEINNIDLTAIEANYDQTHGTVIPYQPIDIEAGSPIFFIDLPAFDEITMGEAFVAPIILGDQDTPVEEIYGIAFTVEYDPGVMDEAGVYVETGSSWLGEQGTQLISIDRSFADEGKIEVSITRTDHNNIAGFGTISYFIGIIDDIAGKAELVINITNVVAITYEEARISLETPASVIDLTSGVEEILENAVTVFPNPAQEVLHITTEGQAPERISVYNTLGQLVTTLNAPGQKEQLEVSEWSSGIYILDIQFSEGSVRRKVEVNR